MTGGALPFGATNRRIFLFSLVDLLNLLLDLQHDVFGLCREVCHHIIRKQYVLRKAGVILRRECAGISQGTASNVAGIKLQ